MRRLLIPALLAGLASAGDEKAYPLPARPDTPVCTIDYRGGYGPPRKNDKPILAILADGRIRAAHVPKGAKLQPAELQALLRFVIEEHRFFEFNRAAVDAQVRALWKQSGGGAMVADAADTIVTVKLRDKGRTVRYNASTWAAQQCPAIRELQDLEAVRKKLHSTMCCAQLGGVAQAKKLLALANAELKKRHPKSKPLEMIDLNWLAVNPDGVRRLQIIRWGAKETAGVWLSIPKKGAPAVELVSVQAR